MSNMNFYVQMLKEFLISSSFEPIDVVTFCTPCWPQLHSTYHQTQVSSIYFMIFLCWPVAYLDVPFIRPDCDFRKSSRHGFVVFLVLPN